jgi:hypothetical protein
MPTRQDPQPHGPAFDGCALCREIAAPHRGRAHIREQETLQLWREPRRRNDDAFLIQLPCACRHTACGHSPDIRMVSAHDAVSTHPSIDFDRADHGEIGEVAATSIGIIEEEQFTGMGIECPNGRHGIGERAEMNGNVRGLRDHLAIGIE